jgi:hypothetical protein
MHIAMGSKGSIKYIGKKKEFSKKNRINQQDVQQKEKRRK